MVSCGVLVIVVKNTGVIVTDKALIDCNSADSIEIPDTVCCFTIGSDPYANLRLKEAEISRFHARIVREKDVYILDDLASKNGTLLNGKQLSAFTQSLLSHDDIVQIGPYSILIQYNQPPNRQHETRLAATQSSQNSASDELIKRLDLPALYPELHCIDLDGEEKYLIIKESDRHYSIGRHKSCDLILDASAVSRRHVSVYKTVDDHVFVIDNSSANGIRINRKTCAGSQEILSGDLIEIGPFTLRLSTPDLETIDISSKPVNSSEIVVVSPCSDLVLPIYQGMMARVFEKNWMIYLSIIMGIFGCLFGMLTTWMLM